MPKEQGLPMKTSQTCCLAFALFGHARRTSKHRWCADTHSTTYHAGARPPSGLALQELSPPLLGVAKGRHVPANSAVHPWEEGREHGSFALSNQVVTILPTLARTSRLQQARVEASTAPLPPQVRMSRRKCTRASTTVRRRASARASSTCVTACTALATSRNMRNLSLWRRPPS